MRRSRMLAQFRAGSCARTCSLGHYLPFYVRHAAHWHYDGIWLDLEHNTLPEREVQAVLALCHTNDIDCMVRPPTVESTRLYRYLEDGATGFMIPFVSTAAIARHVVEAVKFPPLGNRGFGAASLDGDYLLESGRTGTSYFAAANHQTFIVAQIETPEAVANVGEIAAVEGIDCLFLGPADLGLRLQASPREDGMTVEVAMERVAAAAATHGKAWGRTVGAVDDLVRYRQMGAQLLPWGSDFALAEVLQTRSRDLDAVLTP